MSLLKQGFSVLASHIQREIYLTFQPVSQEIQVSKGTGGRSKTRYTRFVPLIPVVVKQKLRVSDSYAIVFLVHIYITVKQNLNNSMSCLPEYIDVRLDARI